MRQNNQASDLNVTATALVIFISGILIFVFIVAVQVLFQWAERAEFERKVVAEVPESLSQLHAAQLTRINTYRLVDEQAGLAAIPIEQAMATFARDPAGAMQVIRAAAPAAPQPAATPAGGATQPAATQPAAPSTAPATAPTPPPTATQPGSDES